MADTADLLLSDEENVAEKKNELNDSIEKKVSTSTDASTPESRAEPITSKNLIDESAIGVASPPQFSVAKIVHDGRCFTPRHGHCVAELKGLMYIYGGINNEGEVKDDMIQFFPEQNSFTIISKASENPGAVAGATFVPFIDYKTSQNVLCLFGGENNVFAECDSTWLYEPESNTWKNLPNAGTYPTARKGHCCVVSDKTNSLYIWGGWNSIDNVLNDGYCLNKSTWSKMRGCDAECAPQGRCYHSGILYFDNVKEREYLYIFGGDISGKGAGTNELWKYDLTSAKWTLINNAVGEIPPPRWNHSATLFDNRMWITGGQYGGWFSNYCFSDSYVYDISANCWFNCNLSTKDFGHHASFGSICLFSLNKAFYVFGGLNNAGQATSDVYYLAPLCTTANLMGMTTEMLKCKSQVKAALQVVDTLQESSTKVLENKEEIKQMFSKYEPLLKNFDETVKKITENYEKSIKEMNQKLQKMDSMEKTIEEMKATIQTLLKREEKVESAATAESTKKTEKVESVAKIESAKKTEKVESVSKIESAKKTEKVESVSKIESAKKTEKQENEEKKENLTQTDKSEKQEKLSNDISNEKKK